LDTDLEEGERAGIQKIAKTIHNENESIEKIIKYTGLSKDQID